MSREGVQGVLGTAAMLNNRWQSVHQSVKGQSSHQSMTDRRCVFILRILIIVVVVGGVVVVVVVVIVIIIIIINEGVSRAARAQVRVLRH
jgi:hypothetical protein